MSQKSLLILLALSPLWFTAGYLLFPQFDFLQNLVERAKVDRWKSVDRYCLIAGFAIFIFLMFAGAPITTLFLILATLAIYIFYLSGNEKRQSAKDRKISEAEFPALLGIFTIYVSAGLSPAQALLRIVESGSGKLITELSEAVMEIKGGMSAVRALEKLSLKTNSQPLRRFLDSLIIAMERGTPLTEILERQNSEARGEERTKSLEKAARSEITLMIPIIFLILPISVLFALWPSYIALGHNIKF